eukprot:g66933.t1
MCNSPRCLTLLPSSPPSLTWTDRPQVIPAQHNPRGPMQLSAPSKNRRLHEATSDKPLQEQWEESPSHQLGSNGRSNGQSNGSAWKALERLHRLSQRDDQKTEDTPHVKAKREPT